MTGSPGGIAASVRRQIAEGRSAEAIVETLVAGGLSKPSAQRFVERAMSEPVEPLPQSESLHFEPYLKAPKATSVAWIRALLLLFSFFAVTLPVYFCTTGMRQARRAASEEFLRQVEADMKGVPARPEQITQAKIDAALEKLQSHDEWERCEAAMVLGQSKNRTAIEPLVNAVRRADSKATTQSCIVRALAQLGEVDVALGYYDMWLDGDNPQMWRDAVTGIGQFGADAPARAVRTLERALVSEAADLRILAVMAAAKIGAESVLEAAAEDEHPQVRTEARNALRAAEQ
jgi:HEAT repeat protein